MFSKSQLKLGIKNPQLLFRLLNRAYYDVADTTPDVSIFEKEWDNLIILDACRYDAFVDVADDRFAKIECISTDSSATVEFLKNHFDGQKLHDVVYITANPQLYRNKDTIDVEFHDVVNVWSDGGWNENFGTVMPEKLQNSALEAAEKYPNKRFLVHFLQPHYPFVNSQIEFGGSHLAESTANADDEMILDPWMQIMTGAIEIETDELWNEYLKNLQLVLPTVETLCERLGGLSVITSDHGNMFGERSSPIPIREWGHPTGIHTNHLVNVPWVSVLNGERREIVTEQPISRSFEISDEAVSDRLKDLGYME